MAGTADAIAGLAVDVRATGVKETDAALRGLETSIGRVEERSARLEKIMLRRAKAEEISARRARELAKQVEMLERAFGKSGTQILELVHQLDDLERRERAVAAATGRTTTATAANTRAVQAATAGQRQMVTAVATADAALRANATAHGIAATAATRSGTAMTAAAGGLRRFGGTVQNVGFQLGDFAVQVASGQNGLVAFTQQFSQFAGGFGPVGAALGAVAAVVGAVAIGFTRAGESADESSTSSARLSDALKSVDADARSAAEAESILAAALDSGRVSAADLTTMSFERVVALQQQQQQAIATAEAEIAGAQARLTAAQVTAQADALMSGAAGGTVSEDNAETAARRAELDRLTAALNAATAARDRFAAAAVGAFNRDFTEPLQAQVDLQNRLSVALRQGAAAVREVQVQEAIRVEQARAGVTADSDRGKAIADLVRQRERLTAVNDNLTEAERQAAAAARKRAEDERRLAEQRADGIADLQDELGYVTELAEAHRRGEEAVRALETARRAELVVQRLQLDGTELEAAAIVELVQRIDQQRAAIEQTTKAQKLAERAAQDLVRENARAATEFEPDLPDEVADDFNTLVSEALS